MKSWKQLVAPGKKELGEGKVEMENYWVCSGPRRTLWLSKLYTGIVWLKGKKIFSGQSPKATEIQAKINKWDLIKLTSFYTAKERYTRQKKTTQRMGENLCKETDKGSISKTYKQLNQLDNQKTTQPKNRQKI